MVNKELEKETLTEIHDVDLVAYLITLGFKLACPARNYTNRYISFLFQRSEVLDQAFLDFFSRRGNLEDARWRMVERQTGCKSHWHCRHHASQLALCEKRPYV
jgi:hypothetical protein